VVKRTEVLKRLSKEAKKNGSEYSEVERTRHTGVIIGSVRSTLGRHAEVDDVTARLFFDQFAAVLGKGWWR